MTKNEILQANKAKYEVKKINDYSKKEIYYNKKMSPYLNLLFNVP